MSRRTIDTVPFEELQPFLNLLTNSGLAEGAVMRAIGYGDGALNDLRMNGKARRSIKYALIGLCAERRSEIAEMLKRDQFVLDFGEAELLFEILHVAREARPGQAAALKRLQARVATELVRLAR